MTQDANNKDEQIQLLTSIQQEYKILAEYKMIESEKIGGVYVIPSYGNSLLWYCVIFVRQGYFNEAVFRFTMLLPDKFPDDTALPTVIFQNEIIHPLICPYTGTLDLTHAFTHWRKGEDHLWQLLKYIKAILQEPLECMRNSAVGGKFSNQEAADLLTQNRAEFISRAKNCVEESKKRIYEPGPTDDPHYVTFEIFSQETHGHLLERLRNGMDPIEIPSSPTAKGLSWVKEGEFKPLSKD